MSLEGAEEPKSSQFVQIPEGVHVQGIIMPWHHQNRIPIRIPPDRAGHIIAETTDTVIASFKFPKHRVCVEISRQMLKAS